jgi:hypothetical protein
MKLPLIVALTLLLCLLFSVSSQAQYAVAHDVAGCGGGQSSGGGYYLNDTVGQPCIGITSGPSNTNKIGYWYMVDAMHIGPTSELAITAFTAQIGEEGVVLSWEIGGSSELSGLNIYRSENQGEGYQKLNDNLIPAERRSYLDETAVPGNTYWYRLGAMNGDGEFLSSERKVEVPPRETTLYQNYPNPFNPLTNVSYYLPETQKVSLVIYDAQGRVVKRLVSQVVELGKHNVIWDGSNDRGETVGSGVYFCRLKAGKKVITKKLALIK